MELITEKIKQFEQEINSYQLLKIIKSLSENHFIESIWVKNIFLHNKNNNEEIRDTRLETSILKFNTKKDLILFEKVENKISELGGIVYKIDVRLYLPQKEVIDLCVDNKKINFKYYSISGNENINRVDDLILKILKLLKEKDDNPEITKQESLF